MITYFDFLPDELIYIIYTYTKTNNNLKELSIKYKNIYNEYLNDIKNGNIFGFKLINPSNVRLKQYFTDKTYGSYKTHLSTSEYYNKINSRVAELHPYERASNPFKEIYDFKNPRNHLIYADQSKAFGSTRTIVIYKYNNNYILKIKPYTSGLLHNFQSNVWKDVWIQMRIDDQNSLLYQHGFVG